MPRLLPLLTALLIAFLAACSPDGGGALTEASFIDLLGIEDIAAGTTVVGPENRLRDVKELGALVDAARVADMDAGYARSFDSVEGPSRSVSFSVIDFDSQASARRYFEKVKSETPGLVEMSRPIGESSARAVLNDNGLGSILVMLKGDKAVSLHTTIAQGQPPLVDVAGLERLAALVARRIK